MFLLSKFNFYIKICFFSFSLYFFGLTLFFNISHTYISNINGIKSDFLFPFRLVCKLWRFDVARNESVRNLEKLKSADNLFWYPRRIGYLCAKPKHTHEYVGGVVWHTLNRWRLLVGIGKHETCNGLSTRCYTKVMTFNLHSSPYILILDDVPLPLYATHIQMLWIVWIPLDFLFHE